MSQSRSVYSFVERPLMMRSPLVYRSRPPMMFRVVVLPQPEGPRMETNSFSRNSKSMPRRASTVLSPMT